jgi:hypothetical protein
MEDSKVIIELLRKIVINQEKVPPFSVGLALCICLAATIGFIISLALNNAFVQTVDLIPIGSDGLVGGWIYAIFVLILGLILLCLIYIYLLPFLQKKLDPLTVKKINK